VGGSDGFWTRRPIMLLIDGQTRGGCELLATVLKERGKAMLIGSPTKGDGVIRETIPVSEAFVVRIATRWVVSTHSGAIRSLGNGLSPDVEVIVDRSEPFIVPAKTDAEENLSEKVKNDMELMARVGGDAVLARATDILLGLKALDGDGSETATRTADSSGDLE